MTATTARTLEKKGLKINKDNAFTRAHFPVSFCTTMTSRFVENVNACCFIVLAVV